MTKDEANALFSNLQTASLYESEKNPQAGLIEIMEAVLKIIEKELDVKTSVNPKGKTFVQFQVGDVKFISSMADYNHQVAVRAENDNKTKAPRFEIKGDLIGDLIGYIKGKL
jgi:hypothetical protein